MTKIDYGKGIPKYEIKDLMRKEELHDFGIEIVFGCLKNDGYEILDVKTEIGVHPSIIAKIGRELYMVEIVTDVAPKNGELEDQLKKQLIEHSLKMNAIPCLASVGIGACDSERFSASLALRGDAFYANFTGLEFLSDTM